MFKFISFGSGSSGNCYFLYTENTGILIDAGVGIRTMKKYFREYGLSWEKVKRIFITHDHADHIKAVGALSMETKANVYTTQTVHDGIVRNFCVRKKVPEAQVKVMEKGSTVTADGMEITSFAVPHDSMDNVGYRVSAHGVTFCLITDAGCITPEIAQQISLADYLVIEANHDEELLRAGRYPAHLQARILSETGHLSNHSCGNALAAYAGENLRRVWLCHLSEDNNRPEIALETITAIVKEKGANYTVNVLERKRPTGVFELTEGSLPYKV